MAPATNDPVAAAQSLSSPASQQAFRDAATKMSQSINNLQNELTSLEKGLPSVQDTGALQVELGNIVKLYKAITWRIKDISSNVSTHVEQLGTAQLPIIAGAMGPVSDAEIVMMLEQYQEGGKTIDQAAKQQVTDFAKVQGSLANLQKNYQTFYNTKGVQQSTEISQLTTEISQLEFQAEQLQQEILRVAKEQQGTFLNRNKWMLAIPILNLIALMSDMIFDSQVKKQLADLRAKYEGIQSQLGQKRLSLARLQEASQLITKYKSVIDGLSNTRIKEVAGGLGIFSDVMDSANEDVIDLIEYKKNGGPVPLALAIFQQTSGSVYGSISQGLRDLAVGR